MKTDNIIQTKSYAYALRIVNLYVFLKNEKRAYVLSKQLLRSATSIGANVEEAIGAQSQKDFVHKKKYRLQRSKRNPLLAQVTF